MSDAPHRIRALLSLLSGWERRLGALSGLLELCALVLVVWAAAMFGLTCMLGKPRHQFLDP